MKRSRYLHPEDSTCFRLPLSYTIGQEKKIASFFPKQYQKAVVKDTTQYCFTLISRLVSKTTPKNITRKKSIEQIEELQERLLSLEVSLQEILQDSTHQNGIKLKRVLREFSRKGYAGASLKEFLSSVTRVRQACVEVKESFKSGHENPHYFAAINNLVNIWLRYWGKMPGLTNDPYADCQKPRGAFLKYVQTAIGDAIEQTNLYFDKPGCFKRKIREIPSLSNIVRQVIRSQKSFMAKNSSK